MVLEAPADVAVNEPRAPGPHAPDHGAGRDARHPRARCQPGGWAHSNAQGRGGGKLTECRTGEATNT
jgi:hypothetical protein